MADAIPSGGTLLRRVARYRGTSLIRKTPPPLYVSPYLGEVFAGKGLVEVVLRVCRCPVALSARRVRVRQDFLSSSLA